MKKSKRIRLALIGGLSAGALTSCSPGPAPVSTSCVYTNNDYIAGVGYYHAPFRAWYPFPLNHRDAQTGRYYFGGSWGEAPFESITNISAPTAAVVQQAQAQRTDVPRGGFGYGGGGHYWGSGISS